jgi:hypothetical protein
MNDDAGVLQMLGAGGFGCLIGWYLYYINRHRSSDVSLADLVTLIGATGSSAVLALFPAKTDLFGAYGVGLFIGFFGYFSILAFNVWKSDNFDRDYFIDGRRRTLAADQVPPTGPDQGAMGEEPDAPDVRG